MTWRVSWVEYDRTGRPHLETRLIGSEAEAVYLETFVAATGGHEIRKTRIRAEPVPVAPRPPPIRAAA